MVENLYGLKRPARNQSISAIVVDQERLIIGEKTNHANPNRLLIRLYRHGTCRMYCCGINDYFWGDIMAKMKRSVWEIRFYALKQFIGFRESALRGIIAQDAIDGKPTDKNLVEQIKLLRMLESKAREIETQKSNRLFLLRDV